MPIISHAPTVVHKFTLVCFSELYIIWKANFSQLHNQKVSHKMAEIEGIFGRHFQFPNVRGQIFF